MLKETILLTAVAVFNIVGLSATETVVSANEAQEIEMTQTDMKGAKASTDINLKAKEHKGCKGGGCGGKKRG